jgi:hypothetical protein
VRASVPEPVQPGRSIKRTMLGIPAPAGELPVQPVRSLPTPVPPAPAPAEFEDSAEPEWTVAVTDDDHEEMTTEQVVTAYADGRINDETFIWAEGMDDWKTPFEIPLIAAELGSRGLSPGDGAMQDDDRTVVAQQVSQSKPPVGVWREPGSWREPTIAEGEEEGDVSFDDVTVSMDSRKAAELLRAAGAQDEMSFAADEPLMLESDVHDDVTKSVDSRRFLAEAGLLTERADSPPPASASAPFESPDFDEEPTQAIENTLISSAHESPPPPGEQRLTGARNEDSVLFSLDALAQSETRPAREERADDDILLAAPAPLPALPKVGPTAEPAASPDRSDDHRPTPESAVIPPQSLPVLPLSSPQPKSASRGWLWVLLLLLLAGAAAAAAYHFKQPVAVFELLGVPTHTGR